MGISPCPFTPYQRPEEKWQRQTCKGTAVEGLRLSGSWPPKIHPWELCFLVSWSPGVHCHLLLLCHGRWQLLVAIIIRPICLLFLARVCVCGRMLSSENHSCHRHQSSCNSLPENTEMGLIGCWCAIVDAGMGRANGLSPVILKAPLSPPSHLYLTVSQ